MSDIKSVFFGEEHGVKFEKKLSPLASVLVVVHSSTIYLQTYFGLNVYFSCGDVTQIPFESKRNL